MNQQHLVFVYGTLRKGYKNHHLMAGARDLGPARSLESYALFLDDYPYLVKSQAVAPVVGELYAVDQSGLARLDQLEEHPNWYCREVITVLDQGGRRHQAWIYFFPRPQGRLLASGDLREAGEY